MFQYPILAVSIMLPKRILFEIGLVLSLGLAPKQAQAAHVNVIELDNRIISPVTQQYIAGAIETSEQRAG
ncbi:MAG: hypothetical protein HYT88_02690 [Candidatus Omnitrophica bacterium]|nr:hypothetical protein [Candidatus Omnitrophota bacterium]